MVASRVSDGPRPAFTSSPALRSNDTSLLPSGRTVPPSTKGFTRTLRPCATSGRPVSVPADEARTREKARETGDQYVTSFFRRLRRLKLRPHTRPSPGWKRSVLNGMRNSAVHPSGTTCAATHHTASQLGFTSRPSLAICVSARAPRALVPKMKPLRRSAKVSSSTSKVSCSAPAKSLRMSLMTRAEGSPSRLSAPMYR